MSENSLLALTTANVQCVPQHFLLGNAEHNSLIIPAEIDNFSNPFWRNSIEISLQSKPFSIKLIPQRPFKKVLFVERWNLSSNCLYSGSNENLAPSTNLAFVYHSSMPCRVHAPHIQYFWYPWYCNFGHAVFKQISYLSL